MPKIVIVIKPSGQIVSEGFNFKGGECHKHLVDWSNAVKGNVTDVSKKPEYWTTPDKQKMKHEV